MGTFRIRIEVGDPSGQHFDAIDALVDTGATNTALPASFLRELGVVPDERATFHLADGREVEYDIGETRVRIDGRQRTTIVVLGEEATEPLLGAVTREEFGLGIDPLRRQLIPVSRLLM